MPVPASDIRGPCPSYVPTMANRIEDLLHRRTDLSTFLVHLTRSGERSTGRENLLSILEAKTIQARSVFGMGRNYANDSDREAFAATQKVVCFTETPLEHVWMMCKEIEGRSMSFDGYGLAFTKTWARRVGVNPVWYIDIERGHDWLTVPINRMLSAAVAAADRGETALEESDVAKITPFIEQMGPTNDGRRKEFWWEREWRHKGDFRFATWRKVVCLFAPESDHENLRGDLELFVARPSKIPPIVDASWGLERMIAAMRGIDEDDAGPLPPRQPPI